MSLKTYSVEFIVVDLFNKYSSEATQLKHEHQASNKDTIKPESLFEHHNDQRHQSNPELPFNNVHMSDLAHESFSKLCGETDSHKQLSWRSSTSVIQLEVYCQIKLHQTSHLFFTCLIKHELHFTSEEEEFTCSGQALTMSPQASGLYGQSSYV